MNTELEKLIEKYLNGKCSAEESRIVEQWYNQLDEDDGRAESTWTSKNQQLKSGVYQRIDLNKRKIKRLVFSRVAAAAAIILLVGTAIFFYTHRTGPDTQKELLSYAESSRVEDISNLKEPRLILDQHKTMDLKGNADIQYEGDDFVVKTDQQNNEQKIHAEANMYSTLVVPYGRRAEIRLADGTKVWLNSGSRLVYPNNFTGNNKREVFLQGEAFFDVSHNAEKPFHVYAKNVDVKVLGTSFNVRAYEDETTMSTVLVEGSVALTDMGQSRNMIQLKPTQMVVYQAGSPFARSTVETKMYTSWKEGYLYMQNQSIAYVIKTLIRYYNIPIQLDINDRERYFSGRLDLQADLKEVMDAIALTTGYTAEKTERGWILR